MGSFSISEILTILVVILVIFGPNRLPEFARKTGKLIAQARKAVASFTAEFEGDYGDAVNPIRDLTDELGGIKQDLTRTVTNLGAVVGGEVPGTEDATVTEAEPADDTEVKGQDGSSGTTTPITAVPDGAPVGAEPSEPEADDQVADVTQQPDAADVAEDPHIGAEPESEAAVEPSSDGQAGEVA